MVYVRNYGTDDELVYERSDAAIAIMEDLGGVWRLMSFLRFLPPKLRDAAYDFVARNRYQWFGKLDECRLPEPDERARFLN
jgi:predicted DCC family thiol-disulfide oxidoreductase YuxK